MNVRIFFTMKKFQKRIPARLVNSNSSFSRLIFTFISFFLYGWYWIYEVCKDTSTLTRTKGKLLPSVATLFSILTLGGFFCFYSAYIIKIQNTFLNKQKKTHLLTFIPGFIGIIIIGSALLLTWSTLQSKFNIIGITGICIIIFIGIFGFINVILLCIIQHKINYIVKIYKNNNWQLPYVKDYSIYNHPFLSMPLIILMGLMLPELFSEVISGFFNEIGDVLQIEALMSIPINPDATDIELAASDIINADSLQNIIKNIATILGSLSILIWFTAKFKYAKYPSSLNKQNILRGLLLVYPGYFIWLLNSLGYITGEEPINFKWGIVLYGCVPGIMEEIAFRGILIPNFLRTFNRSSGVWLALFIPAFMFSICHATNLLSGASVSSTIAQLMYTFGMGALYGAVFIRTGNLWPAVICHSITDILGLMNQAALESGAVQTGETPLVALLFMGCISLWFVIHSIILCRPTKHKEILILWRERFKGHMIPPRPTKSVLKEMYPSQRAIYQAMY